MSVIHIITREHWNVPGGAAFGDYLDVQNWPRFSLATASLALESWPYLSPVASLWRVGPASQTGRTLELSLVAVVWVCQPEDLCVGEMALPL